MNHDPDVYGPDAGEFKPERYLDSSTTNMKDDGHLSFGFGRRHVHLFINLVL
ncbi:hypothetical protein BDQ17DRAFT_1244921 [Cyathus striatus]|nr:hypothetical protein BDQ17DRAFT_1244921 [Cyathus striatus]